MKNKFLINYTYSGIFTNVKKKNLETEALFGEEFVIEKNEKKYCFGTLLSDNYQGWVESKYLSSFVKTTHQVIKPNIIVYNKPNVKSRNLLNLSLGSKVRVINELDKWLKVDLLNNKKYKNGFVNKNHLLKLNTQSCDWVTLAENMNSIPYKWGGRTFLGLDCSALVQLAISVSKNKIFPRNSIDQFNYCIKKGNLTDKPKRGTLVFWHGHVGIMIDDLNLIHANGFHAQVCIEPLEQAVCRLKIECGDIKQFFNLVF